MIPMFDRKGCTVIIDGVEHKDKAAGCFNGGAYMFIGDIYGEDYVYRIEQSGFSYTDEEKAVLQKRTTRDQKD